jgi:hypothetical protein
MFVPIDKSMLVHGTKYKIEDDFIHIAFFRKSRCGDCFTSKKNKFGFMDTTLYLTDSRHYTYLSQPIVVLSDPIFYEFVPQNPQWKMERRAVTMILRRLIGDDCFEW